MGNVGEVKTLKNEINGVYKTERFWLKGFDTIFMGQSGYQCADAANVQFDEVIHSIVIEARRLSDRRHHNVSANEEDLKASD